MTLMSRIKTCVMITFLVVSFASSTVVHAAQPIYQVTGLEDQVTENGWGLHIMGSGLPTYTQYELFNPHRIVIDIAGGDLSKDVILPWQPEKGPLSSVTGVRVNGQDPAVLRFELILAEESQYVVNVDDSNILVQFEKTAPEPVGEKKESVPAAQIQEITVEPGVGYTHIYLNAGQPIKGCKTTELAKAEGRPARLLVDIDSAKTREIAVPGENSADVSLVRAMPFNGIARISVDSVHDDLFSYTIESYEKGLLIRVQSPLQDTAALVADMTGVPFGEIVGLEIPVKEEKAVKRPVSLPASKQKKAAASVAKSKEADNEDSIFTGYTEERISVDFYKIDLHNVFRLIGEISGRNIVVDQGVGGSLTLALNDVPWDFVLDVIMNLKGLAKEERYNTIVISKKDKSFAWPIRLRDNLEIKKEAISVTKRLDVPKERVESKKLVRQASEMEKSGNYPAALDLYEKAFRSSPENGDLAKKIASLALVKMGLNAKAAHYGHLAVKLNPEDAGAALLTALSLANMEQIREARDYFDQAVAGSSPSRQALASYAAFSEQNNSFEMALALLARYEEIYSGSVETMISKARIYDKLGNTAQADQEYQAILLSGYKIPGDLEKFIKNRIQK
ncbi:MAG: AMIN domain-containing protein [Desulfobulbaceae bacterium]|uniref:AMIN domain-containing protein n=1 Tax=Candidatus Desulfobia pelagia TaxID=2841692 RepID=A0A8J6NBB0_9BACT|nr:AMIN domain-containing protein [Candidatus Desulfobia pelagia]